MPFAEGARDCLGQNLAKTSLIATIATLVSHLHFDLAPQVRQSACLARQMPGQECILDLCSLHICKDIHPAMLSTDKVKDEERLRILSMSKNAGAPITGRFTILMLPV